MRVGDKKIRRYVMADVFYYLQAGRAFVETPVFAGDSLGRGLNSQIYTFLRSKLLVITLPKLFSGQRWVVSEAAGKLGPVPIKGKEHEKVQADKFVLYRK